MQRALGWGRPGDLADAKHPCLSGHQEGPRTRWHDSPVPLGKWRALEHNAHDNHETPPTKLENQTAKEFASMLLQTEQIR